MKNVMVFLFVAILVSFSCKKQLNNQSDVGSSVNGGVLAQGTHSSVSTLNSDNVGIIHGEGLDVIMNGTAFPDQIGSIAHFEEYKQLLRDFYLENGFGFYNGMSVADMQMVFDGVKTDKLYDNLYNSGMISNTVRTEMNKMVDIFRASNSHQYTDRALNEFKARVSSTPGYSNKDINILNSAAEVARNSSAYWFNVIDNPTNIWFGGCVPTFPIYALRIKWGKLLADVGGFVVGNALAGPAGGVGLGTMCSACVD